ncbi:hypothetical protein LINPERHAP1_LOCUS9253 [Linum perenne]
MNLFYCSTTRAEMRGAIEGLKHSWVAGYRNVKHQIDSITAISLLSDEGDSIHQHGMEAEQFHELRNRYGDLIIKHTYREGNHTTDFLVSMGSGYTYWTHTFSILYCNLGYYLRYDYMVIYEPMLISSNG